MLSDTGHQASDGEARKGPDPIVIKKYANRRLYNTATSSYVTLDTLSGMVKEGHDFVVFDAKSGEDITRSVLTQIIFEEEAKGANLLPINFLRQLIGFYGNGMQSFVPSYLEMSLEALSKNQEQFTRTFGGEAAIDAMRSMTQRNVSMFENAMQMFSPFGPQAQDAEPGEQRETPRAADPRRQSEIEGLREQVARMQDAIDAMAKKD